MIALLRGTVAAREARALVVDVAGVGYRVSVAGSLLDRAVGDTLTLHIHLHLAGDTIELYGFGSADELGLFRSLLKVSGVGPRSALSILGEVSANQLRAAIIEGDPAPMTRVSGVGRKTAERIILELSGTLAKPSGATEDEAIDALERLGYTPREAAEALRSVGRELTDVRDRIRAALRSLGRRP